MNWKSKEELPFIARKCHAKLEEKLTRRLKNVMRNLANFDQNTWKSQSWDFDGIILSKVENAWAKKVQRSYMSRHWPSLKSLKRNWLVVSKLTLGIWRILTQAVTSLKKLHFNGMLLTKVYNVWAKKAQRSMVA